MDYNSFLTELIKKEVELIGKDKVAAALPKCGIQVDGTGRVVGVKSHDRIAVTTALVKELCTRSPLAKIPARVVVAVYQKSEPNFVIHF